MFSIIEGNLVEAAKAGEVTVIAHGCNCQCIMGAGIARTIRLAWPQTYAADCLTAAWPDKLGLFSKAVIGGLKIYNLYTQPTPGATYKRWALEDALFKMYDDLDPNDVVGLPMIGAGLGGGSPEDTKETIKFVAEYYPNETRLYVLPRRF